MFKNKVLLGISGGIAAYKAPLIVRLLVKNGFEVKVILTESAGEFVSKLSLEAVSGYPVSTDLFSGRSDKSIDHIDLADWADFLLVAPAGANILGKFASGIADNLLTTVFLATTAKVIVAPGMNVHMWEHPAVQNNVEILKTRGVLFVGPDYGELACGYTGYGRMTQPEEIVEFLVDFAFSKKSFLKNKKILITAGATREYLDPVRFISNPSSGKTGVELSKAALKYGAEAVLIYDYMSVPVPSELVSIKVNGAEAMFEAVIKQYNDADVIIMSAAVADWTPVSTSESKMKKGTAGSLWTPEFKRTKDILHYISEKRNKEGKKTPIIIGFAAETPDKNHSLESLAYKKLKDKECDFIIANSVYAEEKGFGKDTNELLIVGKNEFSLTLPEMNKSLLALKIMELINNEFSPEADK